MKELLDDIDRWNSEGLKVALARVTDLEGSGPRDPGAAMAVNEKGEVSGSVSGGCVEGAVVTEALDILGTDRRRTVSFGYSDDEAFAVGLTCGGTIHLFIESLDWQGKPLSAPDAAGAPEPVPIYEALAEALRSDEPAALATIIEGTNQGSRLLLRPGLPPLGSLGNPRLDEVAARDGLAELESGRTCIRHYGVSGEQRRSEVSLFVESFAPQPRMLIFGAVDFTAALAEVAKVVGYKVIVCDARRIFATPKRFPMADEVRVEWPDSTFDAFGDRLRPSDAVCILTHDTKFDVPAVLRALDTEVGYIGVMGSRRTHAKRVQRLREAGVSQDALDKVMAPIGLDIGGRTPAETAISIVAEIIAVRAGRDAPSLRDTEGPIHR